MVQDFITGILSVITDIKLSIVVLLCTCFIYLSPFILDDKVRSEMSLDSFKEDGKTYILILFLLTFFNCVVKGGSYLFDKNKKRRAIKKDIGRRQKMFERLTRAEKDILLLYIVNGTKTNRFPISDGVVGGLMQKGVLFVSSNIGDELSGFPYNITDVAYDYLRENPKLLR